MATLSELTSYVRSQSLIETDDLAATFVHAIINRGYLELAATSRWPWTLTTSSPATTNGVATLPSDIGFLDHVRYGGDYMVQLSRARVEQDEIQANTSGNPSHYFVEGSTLTLVPTPTGSSTVEVTYYAIPAAMANESDSPTFAAPFHYILADYALWKVLQREEMYERANVHRQEYQEAVFRMARYYNMRTNASQRATLGQRQSATYGSNYPFEVA